ncbi:PREDICTED: D-glucuronyl C5-epimerase-like isoform X2 [Priapulus caudatus]|uniref:heparosan-N-sulfate-glucuronate 5-epimerase n=1 Tax=Priapulus caudatus TaxID=37621 RepID=A0ABM1DS54_PRICU|nr:PREDICTED: D-glucuronyl C5-epimerase-like isoform X2 [Priapulus caudatus]
MADDQHLIRRMCRVTTMRFNVKLLLCVIIIAACLMSLSWWAKCGESQLGDSRLYPDRAEESGNHANYPQDPRDARVPKLRLNHETNAESYSNIECLINDEYTVSCRREGKEVYVPFSFLEKYFEVYGKIAVYDGLERFEWQHSYSKVYIPKGKYEPRGIFMSFENYNVEIRDRVKCVSGKEGVPITTQWGPQGYFYAIQIAQYGLSHYSKNITDKSPVVVSYMDSASIDSAARQWKLPDKSSKLSTVRDEELKRSVLEFHTSDTLTSPGVMLRLDRANELVLSTLVSFTGNGSLAVSVQMRDTKDIYTLHYVQSDTVISARGRAVYYGVGARTRWSRLTRDLFIDLQKGLPLIDRFSRKVKLKNLKVVAVFLRGGGRVADLTLSTTEHLRLFFLAADWLVANQDENGGWPIDVTRTLIPGVMELAPGWYSAMAQGQAMSALTRAYWKTREPRYAAAALAAADIFSVPSERRGVVATYMDKYRWYEEYPTTPSSFVLNGFIYSLIGLYDLGAMCGGSSGDGAVCTAAQAARVARLYRDGMVSLKAMLPLFDMGSGSSYDLRHVVVPGSAPNLARWDYHTTHINQLLLLTTIDDSPVLKNVAARWMEYMKGKRAKHN